MASPTTAPKIERTGSDSDPGPHSAASRAQPVVLLSSEAHYKIRLPEASFGIVQDPNYTPMMDENERACLDRLCPFADGNPRRLKRIINVFNVGRRVVELRRGEKWPGLTEFKPKLLKFVIMLEQWPYRAPSMSQKMAATPAAMCHIWLPRAALWPRLGASSLEDGGHRGSEETR